MLPELKELVERYQPEVLWADGDWEATPEYFGSKDFRAWLYNDSPVKDTVVTNDRCQKCLQYTNKNDNRTFLK